MDKFMQKLVYLWIILYVFDAPIQYILLMGGIQNIGVYLKMIIPVFVIFVGLYNMCKKPIVSKKFINILLLVFISILIALINQLPFIQIIYGVKTIIPFIFMYLYMTYIQKNNIRFDIIFRIVVPIVVMGIFLDKYLTFPWEGLGYQLGEYEVKVNRQWETFGMERLSGFQRASYDSAIILTILLLMRELNYSIITKRSFIFKMLDGLLILMAIYAVYLTTFKSAYILIGAYFLVYLQIKFYNAVKGSLLGPISILTTRVLFFLMFIYSILPPLLSYIGHNNLFSKLINSNSLYRVILTSYDVRMTQTWPESLYLLESTQFNGMLGRGIGGIGTAQKYAEPYMYNPADNIYIYLFVSIGFLIVPILISILKMIFSIELKSIKSYSKIVFLLVIFCYGATINFIESPFIMAFLGLLLAYSSKVEKNPKILN
ncbi:hypothetical protein [Bacillus cereus]